MQADYVLDYDVLSVEREHKIYLLARIKAKSSPQSSERVPLNISIILDRSGSMAGEKLDYVKKAAQFLVQHLSIDDRISLVSYNQNVSVDMAPRSVARKDDVNRIIESLSPGGTTNLSGGWLQGCQLVSQNLAERQVNRALLLTDGLANQGITDPAKLVSMSRQKRDEGISTTTMGVGMGFNEDLLTEMASEGGGAFYFIDNPDQAPHIFAEELQDLLTVIGQNLVVTLRTTGVVTEVNQLNTYPIEKFEKNISYRLGDLYSDELKTLLLELTIPKFNTIGQFEIAKLKFEYDEIGEEKVEHRVLELPITVNAVYEEEAQDQIGNQEVLKSALLLQAARAREEAIQFADIGSFEQASEVLTKAADAIQESGLDDSELLAEHNMLREEAVDMEMGALRYDNHSRKSSRSKVMYSTQRPRHDETVMMHTRLKASRSALERAGSTPIMMLWKQHHLTLTMDQLRIGRASDNDIVLNEDEVSAHHCQIVRRDGTLYLEDLQSTNGTFANGGRVESPFRLSAGDVVTVGSTLFMFKQ